MAADLRSFERALACGAEQQIGQYRLDLATGQWWWSAQTFRMHGFEPGQVVPTTDLILAHKHPDDRDRVREVLNEACDTGEPFSSMHRIMDARGRERVLVISGQGRRADSGGVCELVGYFIDVTRAVAAQAQEKTRRDIAAASMTRGPIEQAKGVIAAAFGIGPEEAFLMIRRASNNHNIALREYARRIVDEATRGDCAERVAALLK